MIKKHTSQKQYWQRKRAGMQQIERMEMERARKMTSSEKWKETCMLFQFARAMPCSGTTDTELTEVRDRWRLLKRGKKAS